ncbi:DegT/DnrJ/EryC1/StrS aminotransferase [Gloeomargarita lithophora Alchichica-D10]|uniref:DegT/DnrJ/EryC1/StrS aminotransferase n=1 Tax=Gloeomargarita lithophora Alchichica-D10 TaxID=1188229 RepID=A0A1J0AFZ0_9CYAN|nr:DegT/DnrJ/EryC1/StrS family aminotransferase [Gloeomargarita lithophora]APB34837.1 DegT/DnrJ/EryC1/StrS aminotransferase [Gloeomargarita lithophora Alchichica-D10]
MMPVATAIPQFDLTRQYQQLQAVFTPITQAVLAGGGYIGGTAVAQFEQAFAEYVGVPHCISCNSGTDALYLALRALGITAGDEVITPAFSFIATAEAISLTGATPVFVDVEPDTFNLNLDQVVQRLTAKTKAVLPVHLFGRPVDMTALHQLAQARGLAIIEDCAQATGSHWQGQPVGTWGTLGCFSFYPTKNLGAMGDGGAVTTHDPQLAQRLREIKNHGQRERYNSVTVGINSRLDALQAAWLTAKLDYLPQWLSQRRALADNYQKLLANIPGLTLPQDCPGHSWNQYTITLQSNHINRDDLRPKLQQAGIGTAVYYPVPLPLQPVYEFLQYDKATIPQSFALSQRVLSLPLFPELTPAEQQQVAGTVRRMLGG